MSKENQRLSGAMNLLNHGEYLSPLYFPLPGQRPEVNTAEARPEGQGKVIQRYRKDAAASQQPQTLGWIKTLYEDSLEYTAKTEGLRGLSFASGLLFAPMLIFLGSLPLGRLSNLLSASHPTWYVLTVGFIFVVGVLFIPLGIALGLFSISIECRHPADQPIIFDRRHRKVYRLFQELPDGILSLFRRRSIKACAYEWSLVDAEHQGEIMITGATAQSNHSLVFHVRRSESDPTIIDSFEVGSAMSLSSELVDATWEHIRRFMEEDGPHLPSPNEPLTRKNPPQRWWQSVGATGFIGAGYLGRWEHQPGFMALMHALAPVTVPLTLLWGTGNWLSHRTEVEVQWPDEVLAAVGVPREHSAVLGR